MQPGWKNARIFISSIVPYPASCGNVLPALVAHIILPLEAYYETIRREDMFTYFQPGCI